jgi:hypothetical protein
MLQPYKHAYFNVYIAIASYCNSRNNEQRLHKKNTVIEVKMKIPWKKLLLDVMENFDHKTHTYSTLIKWDSLHIISNNKTFSMMWENHAMIERESRKKDCFVTVILAE